MIYQIQKSKNIQKMYEENYTALMKKENLQTKRHSMFMDRKSSLIYSHNRIPVKIQHVFMGVSGQKTHES